MSELEKLAQHRDAILLAELAGLLHNIGKLNSNFLRSTVSNEGDVVTLLRQHNQFIDGYTVKRFARPSEDILDASVKPQLATTKKLDASQLPGQSPSNDLERAQQRAAENFNRFYRGTGVLSDAQAQSLSSPNFRLDVVGEQWLLADLLTLFWDEFFYKPNNNDYQRVFALDRWLANKRNEVPHLLIHAHGEISGSEKYQIIVSEDTGVIATQDVAQEKTAFENLRIATAFGYETQIESLRLQAKQQRLIASIPSLSLAGNHWRTRFQAALRHGLGDTQRPINEITLWDYASSIAALFKTGIAKCFLEERLNDANQVHWRLLGVRFDGLEFLSQVSRLADLLGRQQHYQKALNQVCIALTQDTPIASQIYQDENGLFFVVPDSDLLKLDDLCQLVHDTLDKTGFTDIRPSIAWSTERRRGKQLNLGVEIEQQDKLKRPSVDPHKVEKWWKDSHTQICEVCGLYPAINKDVGYCATCRNNRQSRVTTWLDNPSATIWLDEVADSNGRLALVAGQFSLSKFLDGTLVETLALGMSESTGLPVPKFASFPRVQRIWQTTQVFWKQTQVGINQTLTDARRRLIIQLAKQPGFTEHQVYELDLLGHTRMSVLWDGSRLISTDNLTYTAVQLNINVKERQNPADAALAVGAWLEENKQRIFFQLISVDEKNKRFDIRIADIDYQDTAYAPTIPILTEPRTFMALVPADRALDVIGAIRTKYEREMGKVRNRLPLHLGAVYFHRRTPLRAALDAGRRMLRQKPLGSDQPWTVQDKPQPVGKDDLPPGLADGTQQFDSAIPVKLAQHGRTLTWHVPTVMGDGVTEDNWYPYVFFHSDKEGQRDPSHCSEPRASGFKARRPKSDGSCEECWLIHASQLKAGDQVYFTPATFDFEWLDSSGRRFEIAYDPQTGRRLTHAGLLQGRPYLLDELAALQQAWALIAGTGGLTSSQIHALRDLVEAKRESWQPTPADCEPDGMFWRFCRDAVVNANWGSTPTCEQGKQLAGWAVSGLLADVVQLYMGILKEKPKRKEASNE